jgi:hypothetical protein
MGAPGPSLLGTGESNEPNRPALKRSRRGSAVVFTQHQSARPRAPHPCVARVGKRRTQIPSYAEGADLQASEKPHPAHNPVILRARALGAPRTTQVVHGVSGAKDLLWKATNPSIVIANIYGWPHRTPQTPCIRARLQSCRKPSKRTWALAPECSLEEGVALAVVCQHLARVRVRLRTDHAGWALPHRRVV